MADRIAVLIPYYNGEKYIEKCLSSLTCSYSDLWIIDNSENSESLLFSRYPEINHIVTEDKRLGFAKAVNIGLKKISDKAYSSVIILNQDAYFKEGHFDVYCNLIEENPHHFICPLLYMEHFTELIPFIKERYFKGGVPEKIMYLKDYVGVVIAGKVSLFDELDGFDEDFFMYFEENDLFKRAGLEEPILLTPDVHVAHRNKEEKMESESLDWFFKSEVLYAKKHESIFRFLYLKLKYHLRKVLK